MEQKEPTMKSCLIQINFTASDGYSSKAGYSSKRIGSVRQTMATAVDEIARLAELFGFGEDIEAAVKDARIRVKQWKGERR